MSKPVFYIKYAILKPSLTGCDFSNRCPVGVQGYGLLLQAIAVVHKEDMIWVFHSLVRELSVDKDVILRNLDVTLDAYHGSHIL